MLNNNSNFKIVHSQDFIQLKNRIQTLISVGQYEEANALRGKERQLEKMELGKAALESEMDIDKIRQKLMGLHEKAIHAMLRRIERDRREQLKHRQDDTHRLIQRNKNLLKDIYNRQGQEKRKTKQFLTWALSDINVIENYRNSANPVAQSMKMKRRKERQLINDQKITSKLMAPKTHKVK